jgi:hypothetical protein
VGEGAAYSTVHSRLSKYLGRAAGHQCSCGRPAVDWAYDHGDPDERLNPEGQPYSPDPSHYRPMCRGCHTRFDSQRA